MESQPTEGVGGYLYVEKIDSLVVYSTEADTPDDYRDKMKNRCFICKEPFKNYPDYYAKFGNCCQYCNSRINRRLKHKH